MTRRIGENGEACLPQVGYARNISSGGLFFYTEDPAARGERMLFSIYPNGAWAEGETPLKLVAQGQVVRVDRVSAPHLPGEEHRVAVRFDHRPEIVLEDNDIASAMVLMERSSSKTTFSHPSERISASAK